MIRFFFQIPRLAILALLSLLASCACPPPVLQEAPEPVTSGEHRQHQFTVAANPELGFSTALFNPDEEELTIALPVLHTTPTQSWRLRILEPEAPYLVFHEWLGEGQPPANLVWDGKNANGEWVHSATDYPVIFSAYDGLDNARHIQTSILVDAFVIREGDSMRMLVPSIVFGANSGNWDNLDAETIANNEWVLSRIALTLNRHANYTVKIEGHANPTINPRNAAGRLYEETRELQPLSEARASTIQNELVKLGISERRLSHYGIGGTHPVAAWEDHDNWWKNRRVEFILE